MWKRRVRTTRKNRIIFRTAIQIVYSTMLFVCSQVDANFALFLVINKKHLLSTRERQQQYLSQAKSKKDLSIFFTKVKSNINIFYKQLCFP